MMSLFIYPTFIIKLTFQVALKKLPIENYQCFFKIKNFCISVIS